MKNDHIISEISLKEKLISLFGEQITPRTAHEAEPMKEIRLKALETFKRLGFPHTKLEEWRSTNLQTTIQKDYRLLFENPDGKIDVTSIFRCDIHHLDTFLITLYNGWFLGQDEMTVYPDGTIIGSFAKACQDYPDLVAKHYATLATIENNSLNALNTAFAIDGVFIYVPDHVEVKKTIQIVNIINSEENLFIQPRNLVVLGKNSKLQLVHCDHSVNHKYTFINSVTEIVIGEGSGVDHYKLQNKDNDSTQITTTYFKQNANSTLTSNVITLNGGLIRNNLFVNLDGKGCTASMNGVFLVDKEQHVDNFLAINHNESDSISHQLYKGILDDQAMGVFTGHILVQKDAQRTNAFQNNKNILLTDKATIHTQPHLEIYADDVKCSHGATVGQLDPDALFYMRSRGIRENTSRMLLMYAFAAEVINKIQIDPLRKQIDELVYRRLKGELSDCDQCILDCNAQRHISFDIDLSRI
jgi:Fe-S cluster assembly protein SufD